MTDSGGPVLDLTEGRFSRFESIAWWEQARLARARVLVVGVGALGNEVVKNLAMLGIGHLALIDMDRVEESNLSRSVLFRARDEGQPKVACAARAAADIYPAIKTRAIQGNALADAGLGLFRWADVVVGALDNREARVFVNSACARVGRPWIDGGIDVLQGIVRAFAPPRTACYECTMSRVDWDQIHKRRSCSLLARRAAAAGRTPTTPTMASIIGAIQAQEVVKILHGMDEFLGRGYLFEGRAHSSAPIGYPISPDCPWHEPASPIRAEPELDRDTPLTRVWAAGVQALGPLDALDLSRDLVERMECPGCARTRDVFKPVEHVAHSALLCDVCEIEQAPRFFHSLPSGSPLLERSARELGLPAWDIVWARRGADVVGIELSGDEPTVGAV